MPYLNTVALSDTMTVGTLPEVVKKSDIPLPVLLLYHE